MPTTGCGSQQQWCFQEPGEVNHLDFISCGNSLSLENHQEHTIILGYLNYMSKNTIARLLVAKNQI